MRIDLRSLLPFTPIAIPVAALVAYWGPVTDWLVRAPDVPKSLSSHSLYHHATNWTLVWRGAHLHANELWPVLGAVLFVVLMRALLGLHQRRPRQAPVLQRGSRPAN